MAQIKSDEVCGDSCDVAAITNREYSDTDVTRSINFLGYALILPFSSIQFYTSQLTSSFQPTTKLEDCSIVVS